VEEPTICVVGAANMDLISYVPRLPREGETLHGTRFQMGYGGKGANQAVMAAKLGARVSMVTKLGNDVFGAGTRDNFVHFGIDVTHVLTTDAAFSGVAPIAVDADGRNAIIIVTGANDLLTAAEIHAARETIAEAAVLVCQLEIPVDVTLAALAEARSAGVRTIFNPAPATADLPAEAYRLADLVCPNEGETELLTGCPVDTLPEAERAAAVLLGRGCGAVVLTLGARGCLVVTAEGATHLPVDPVPVVDTTGAGDAFVGSLAYLWARGFDLIDAARRASQVAALSVTGRGTQSSFPAAADLPPDLLAAGAAPPP